MTSVCSTSPPSFGPLAGGSSPAKSGLSPISMSPNRLARRPSAGPTSPRRGPGSGSASLGAAATSPASIQHSFNSIHIPPLNLPRGHDSSDVAAFSSSIGDSGPSSLKRGVQSILDTASPRVKTIEVSTASQVVDLQPSTSAVSMGDEPMGPFEGPEKLLELWFADAADEVVQGGLMRVDRQIWENMLDIVKCKVLSVIHGHNVDAYLLSESSMFVFPHKIILKTCGTTTLLLGLERLLSIAFDFLKAVDNTTPAASLSRRELGSFVKRCFYSRKSFMFPERQQGPHRDWMLEVGALDEFFDSGAAYTVGKMNGNHWLLYLTTPAIAQEHPKSNAVARPLRLPSMPRPSPPADETLEILMTHLSPSSCTRFEFPASMATPTASQSQAAEKDRGHLLGTDLCISLGLKDLFAETSIDAFAFEPCGFSANAVVGRDGGKGGEDGYWTVHVTPEQDSSYASFETNMATLHSGKGLPWLIARVMTIFEPARLSVTLFTSSETSEEGGEDEVATPSVGQGDAPIDTEADDLVTICKKQDQGDILHALQLKGYRRTDRIAYEFEDYDLVFVSFDKVGATLTQL